MSMLMDYLAYTLYFAAFCPVFIDAAMNNVQACSPKFDLQHTDYVLLSEDGLKALTI